MSYRRNLEKGYRLADVEPGAKTGVYYMPICNLPFNTSWRDLKAWLRMDCDVDHVEVFQRSTSGWIRLRGEENFDKAFARMKGIDYRNRALIAIDNNRTQSIFIKQLVEDQDCPRPPKKFRSQKSKPNHRGPRTRAPTRAPARAPAHASDVAFLLEPIAMMNLGYDAGSGNPVLKGPNMLAAAPYYAPGSLTAATFVPAGPSRSGPKFGAFVPAGSQTASWARSETFIPQRGSRNHNTLPMGPRPRQLTPEEACKVIVTSIQTNTSARDVSKWVRHQIADYAAAITRLWVPSTRDKERIRGHAYILLSNASAADATVRILHQKPFHGRLVEARLTNEGVTCAEKSRHVNKRRRQQAPRPPPFSRHDRAAQPARLLGGTTKPAARGQPMQTRRASTDQTARSRKSQPASTTVTPPEAKDDDDAPPVPAAAAAAAAPAPAATAAAAAPAPAVVTITGPVIACGSFHPPMAMTADRSL